MNVRAGREGLACTAAQARWRATRWQGRTTLWRAAHAPRRPSRRRAREGHQKPCSARSPVVGAFPLEAARRAGGGSAATSRSLLRKDLGGYCTPYDRQTDRQTTVMHRQQTQDRQAVSHAGTHARRVDEAASGDAPCTTRSSTSSARSHALWLSGALARWLPLRACFTPSSCPNAPPSVRVSRPRCPSSPP